MVESLLATPALWIGGGILILLLIVFVVIRVLNRRRVVALASEPPVNADEEAAKRKLAAVREHFTASGRFIAQPLEAPTATQQGGQGPVASLHVTDAAHAGRLAREAAVHLACGDLPAA
jgi:hypothetical protein